MVGKEKIKKLLRVIGLTLICGSILFSFYFVYNKYKDRQQTNKIIDQVFIDKEIVPTTEVDTIETSEIKSSNDTNNFSNKYLGYIELSNYGIKRLITSGTSKDILDKGFVGMLSTSALLDDEVGNIILAGHNISNVFQKLHSMKIEDEIKIVSYNNTYIYEIKEKHTISDDDFSYFKKENNKKMLTLVTCKNNNYQRLIVVAELRS